VVKFYGFDSTNWWTCAYVLVIFIVAFRVLAACALAHQAYSQQGNIDFSQYLAKRAASDKAAGPNEVPAPTVVEAFEAN